MINFRLTAMTVMTMLTSLVLPWSRMAMLSTVWMQQTLLLWRHL